MRQSLIVLYDLRGADTKSTDYESLIEQIKAYPGWGRITESAWIVITDEETTEVRDRLGSFLDPDDRIFVGPLGKPAAWRNVMASSDWIKKRP
jgi:hypothetical protein